MGTKKRRGRKKVLLEETKKRNVRRKENKFERAGEIEMGWVEWRVDPFPKSHSKT